MNLTDSPRATKNIDVKKPETRKVNSENTEEGTPKEEKTATPRSNPPTYTPTLSHPPSIKKKRVFSRIQHNTQSLIDSDDDVFISASQAL